GCVFEGFLPVKHGRRLNRLKALRELALTIVIYESPHRIVATLEAVGEVFGEAPIVVAREITKQFEEIVTGPSRDHVARLSATTIRGEFVLVIPAARGSSRQSAGDAGEAALGGGDPELGA